MARPRLAVMKLTERAAERVRELTGDAGKAGVRVGVRNGGCAGMEYTLETVEAPSVADDLVSEHGVNVYVDPKAVLFRIGAGMDFETTKLRSGFTFKNPNEFSACGCGESGMLKPAERLARPPQPRRNTAPIPQ